jgi:SET domain-containing protein
MVINPPTKIVIKKSSIHGYGVFASQNIKMGEVIEETPLLLMMGRGEVSSCMIDYRFNYPKSIEYTNQAVAWGYGSLYNHSNQANADWRDNFDNQTFEFYATKDINEGEEIFLYYGGVDYWGDGRTHTEVKDG